VSEKARARQRLLEQLLGPGEPELGCEECFAQLDRYVELELAGQNPEELIPGMRAHLAGCAACAEDHDSLRAYLLELASPRKLLRPK